ncbi:hypothetical protein D3C74_339100 [compost metagenome]
MPDVQRFYQLPLPVRIRCHYADGMPVIIDPAGLQHRQHRIAVFQCLPQRFQHHQSGTLARNEAVCVSREHAAAASGGQGFGAAEILIGGRRQHKMNATGNGRSAFPPADRGCGQMQRDQGRGAGRIYHHAWPFEVKFLGSPCRNHIDDIIHQKVGMSSRNPQLPLPFFHNTLLLHARQHREAVKALKIHSVQSIQVIFEIGIAPRTDKQSDIPAVHLLP